MRRGVESVGEPTSSGLWLVPNGVRLPVNEDDRAGHEIDQIVTDGVVYQSAQG